MGVSSIDYLKMDIEGAEFDVMDQIFNVGIPIKQIGIEVHDSLFSDGSSLDKLNSIISVFKNNNYRRAFISDNGHELTFIKDEL